MHKRGGHVETGAEAGVMRAGARGCRRCRRREGPSLEPPEDARPCRPLAFRLQPPGPGESRFLLLQVPSLWALVTVAPGCWSRRGSGPPGVCLAECGCLELGLGEAGGAPVSFRSSHSGLLLPRLSLSLPASSGGSPPKLWASLGDEEGAQGSPRAAHPLGGAGGGLLLLRHNLKIWTAAFPEALGSPRSPQRHLH